MAENSKALNLHTEFACFKTNYEGHINGFDKTNNLHTNIVSVAASFQFINDYFENHFAKLLPICTDKYKVSIKAILDAHCAFNRRVGEFYGQTSKFFSMNRKLLAAVGSPTTSDEHVKLFITELKKKVDDFPDISNVVNDYEKALQLFNEALTNYSGIKNFDHIIAQVAERKNAVIQAQSEWEIYAKEVIITTENIKMLELLTPESMADYLEEEYNSLSQELKIWEQHYLNACSDHGEQNAHYTKLFGFKIYTGTKGKSTEKYQNYCKTKVDSIRKFINDNLSRRSSIMKDHRKMITELKGNLLIVTKTEEVKKKELDTEITNYDGAMREYNNALSSFGGLSADNRHKLGEILESLLKGIGYLCFSLGNVNGQILAFKKEFQVDSPVACLRLVDFLAPLLECSAVSHVRITQDVTFLVNGDFTSDLKILNTILERRPEQLDQTVPSIANSTFDKIDALEGKISTEVEKIDVPTLERKVRIRF